ncbi:ABC transporter substrate-binding protein [Anaerobium acetethylicum]|uniref:Ribose transport system substrate-binding protein n=1 Tax=Anaerobium acetethylicum TaxID=1619234 RepID=A0A1D3TSY9_9FIRM|nr:ABC transporter substrate-binding protein [Anaerobium acetethylicum]SCP97044.1 ribose transport system substrate-binding protein [Anaerobium acetethylicum]
MRKKVLSVLLCAAMTAAMLSGCGSKDAATTETTETTDKKESASDEELFVYMVSKGFQHQYWQAVKKGADEAAAELGAKIEFVGPNTESDIADQVQMLNNAINLKPDAIGLASLSTDACLEAIQAAKDAGIPIIGFDSGVPNAPEGAVFANASTDNYKAGELAAENTFPIIKDKITGATATVRIGVMNQDATAESIINRGSGFIDKMKSLIEAEGKTVSVEGHDKWNDKKDNADVIIEVAVPSAVTAEASSIDGQNLLNKKDIIAVYGSNQHSGEALVNADSNLKKLGPDGVIGVAFDSGSLIKGAVKNGTLAGAVTQDPVSIGRKTVELAVAAAKGEKVADVDTGCRWYTADNMDDAEIAPNLYD